MEFSDHVDSESSEIKNEPLGLGLYSSSGKTQKISSSQEESEKVEKSGGNSRDRKYKLRNRKRQTTKDEAASGYFTAYEGLNKVNRICAPELDDEEQHKPRKVSRITDRSSFIKKHKE